MIDRMIPQRPLPSMHHRRRQYALLLILTVVVGCTFLSGSIDNEPDPAEIQRLVQEDRAETPNQPELSPSDSAQSFDPLEGYPDWNLGQTAADALGRIGAPATAELIRALQDVDPERRRRAIRVLARIGPDAVDAVPALMEALQDPDPLVPKAAARALGQIGPDAAAAVPALMELLHQEE